MDKKTLPAVDILIIGASVAGTAAACGFSARGLRTAIVERAQMCASEFADALHTVGNTMAYRPSTQEGQAFADELRQRDILSDDGISLPAVAPVISARLTASGTTLYAPACITAISSSGKGYEVSFASMGGIFTICACSIVDTTASFITAPWFNLAKPETTREYHANAVGTLPASPDVIRGARDDEYFVSVPVNNGDFDAAREALLERLTGTEAKMVIAPMCADVYGASTGGQIADTLYHLPSASFGTVTAAYDAGAALGNTWKGCGKTLACAQLPVQDGGSWDVIVCGAGTAGALAALSAAREGGRVLLIEDGATLGGMGTAGGVLGYYFGVPGGLYAEADAMSREMQDTLAIEHMGGNGNLSKQMALGRLLRKAGVTIRYEATAIGVLQSENRVNGVRYQTEDGQFEAKALFVIDATAEGCLLRQAGAPRMAGRAVDGSYQPYSNVYGVYNYERRLAYFQYGDNGIVNPYDPAALGQAIMTSGCSVSHLWESFGDPEFRYLCTCSRIGLREGERIIGEETVCFEDLLHDRVSDQPLFWGFSNFDNHGKDNALENDLCRQWNTVASMWGYNMTIPIPAGALIPKGMDGILAAGRCIAVDHTVASAVRMRYDMQKSGEAAGVLAMEAIRRHCPAREVPYAVMREKMLATGCLDEDTKPAVIRIGQKKERFVMSEGRYWVDDAASLREMLAGTQPGYAIWSAFVHAENCYAMLLEAVKSPEYALRAHAAFALGLAGTAGYDASAAIPVLLEIAADKSGYVVDSGRKYNYPHAISAAVVLEMLGVREVIDILLPWITDPVYADGIPFTACELTEDLEDHRFQHFLQAFGALCGLYKRFPRERGRIAAAIDGRIDREDFNLTVTGKMTRVVRIDYTEKVRTIWKQCKESV